MRNIVLSGFGRFGAYEANPTETIARMLDKKVLGGVRVHSKVYEAAIPRINVGEDIIKFARARDARAIVALGVASEKKGLCVETAGSNKVENLKYCPPELNGTRIDARYPYAATESADLAPWNLQRFREICERESIPVTGLSADAGGFCCNHLVYQYLVAKRSTHAWDGAFIFLHIPCSPESAPQGGFEKGSCKITIPTEVVIRGLDILLSGTSF